MTAVAIGDRRHQMLARFTRLSCALLAIAAAASAQAAEKPPAPAPTFQLGPELWQGVRIGMTQDQVSVLFPKATASKGELLPTGARSALIVDTTAGGAPAKAQFYFDTASGLAAVIIDRPDVAPGKTDENLAKARQVIDDVTAAHGAPTTCDEQRRLAALTCTWKLGATKAVVSYRDIGGAAPNLSIAYRKVDDLKRWAPGPVKKLKLR
jgi:hypothetical protein